MKNEIKASFTPGPWHTPGEVFNPMEHGQKPETYKAIGIGNGSSHVGYASVSGCNSEAEALANAQLMAETPSLLAALESCAAFLYAWGQPYPATIQERHQAFKDKAEFARAAIAKATT